MSTFNLLGASAVDYRTVDLTFSENLGSSGGNVALILSPSSYSISSGLAILAIEQTSVVTVRLHTSNQNPGTSYAVTVTANIVGSPDHLTNRTALFTGVAAPSKYVVSGADARSYCAGNAISLAWTNPTSPSGADRGFE